MPLSFDIIKPRQNLERQWAYLVKRGQENTTALLKKFVVGLFFATLLYLLFYFITPVNDFVVLKGLAMVMTAVAWFALPVVYLLLELGRARGKRRLKQFLDSVTDSQLSYSVQIEEEKVTITSTDYAYEISWAEFSAFGIYQDTLYIFNTVEGINSLYWDRSEMGGEAFSGLVEILKQKLIRQAF